MSSDEDYLKRIASDYANEVVEKQNYSFIDNEFTQKCMFSNRYGTSFSTDKYKKLQAKWYESFSVSKCTMNPLEMNGKILTCAFEIKSNHTGDFLGVKSTGNSLTVKGSFDLMLTAKSLSFLSSNANIEHILKQITSEEATDPMYTVAIKPLAYRFFTDTLIYLEFIGVHISCRQLQTLCLWVGGRTDSEIAAVIGVNKRTISSYQNDLKLIFDTRRKHMLYEKLLEMDVMHLINQCLFFMIQSAEAGPPVFTKKGLRDANKQKRSYI